MCISKLCSDAPMISTASCVMFLMRTRASGSGLGPGNQEFLGPPKWHRVDRRVPIGTQKSLDLSGCKGLS
jgi:hypothetical protein